MKLHEFTDRLYAMGGIEQEEKRSRRLNESVRIVFKRNGRILHEDVDIEWPDTTYSSDDVKEAVYNAIADSGIQENHIQSIEYCDAGRFDKSDLITVLFDDYSDEDEILNIKQNGGLYNFFLRAFNDYNDYLEEDKFNESLTEARNPENAEVNAIIRKHLGKKSKISKKEQAVLDKYGISRDEYGDFTGPNGKKLMANGRKSFSGPEAPVIRGFRRDRGNQDFDWSSDSFYMDGNEESFDAVDYANYLTKEQPGSGNIPALNNR
jgi:hypothetical protein